MYSIGEIVIYNSQRFYNSYSLKRAGFARISNFTEHNKKHCFYPLIMIIPRFVVQAD